MPSTEGREVNKPWFENRGGITIEYTIPEGNGRNTVDAIVRDAQNNEISRARIVAVEGTGTYRRWQNDIGGGASYYESGGPDTVGYGQHFAPGASTSGRPTSEFETSPDLTRVRTLSYDDNGEFAGVDIGSRNAAGLYDNTHVDLLGNEFATTTRVGPTGELVSDFAEQVNAAGYGTKVDPKGGPNWDIYPDDNGRRVERRIDPVTNGYEFKYSVGDLFVNELRDPSGRVLRLTESRSGEIVRERIRVGDRLATGKVGADGKLAYEFTDTSQVGATMFTLPWEDRPTARTGRMTFTSTGSRIAYDDGEVLELGTNGELTSYRSPEDRRALWKKAVSFAGGYYYGLGSSAVGAVVGLGALSGINDDINAGLELAGQEFRLPSSWDAAKAIGLGLWDIATTAHNAYTTVNTEGIGLAFGDRSLDEAWRNVRRAVGANWNASSKFIIGTDWEGASGHLPETLGQATFGIATLFAPSKGAGSLGKGTRPRIGGSPLPKGPIARGRSFPSVGPALNGRASVARLGEWKSRAMEFGRTASRGFRDWGNQPVKSIERLSEVWAVFDSGFGPRLAAEGVPTAGPTSIGAGLLEKAAALPKQFVAKIESGFGARGGSSRDPGGASGGGRPPWQTDPRLSDRGRRIVDEYAGEIGQALDDVPIFGTNRRGEPVERPRTHGYLLEGGDRVPNIYSRSPHEDPHLIESGGVHFPPTDYIDMRLSLNPRPDSRFKVEKSWSSHVEMKAVALLDDILEMGKLRNSVLVINHPGGVCAQCASRLPYLLGPAHNLTVVWHGGSRTY